MDTDFYTVDSCHSRWIFDEETLRFRRVLKGLGHGDQAATTEWRPYHELRLDPKSDSFVVVLNKEATRILRSWRHTGPTCLQCGETGTQELSIEDIAHSNSG